MNSGFHHARGVSQPPHGSISGPSQEVQCLGIYSSPRGRGSSSRVFSGSFPVSFGVTSSPGYSHDLPSTLGGTPPTMSMVSLFHGFTWPTVSISSRLALSYGRVDGHRRVTCPAAGSIISFPFKSRSSPHGPGGDGADVSAVAAAGSPASTRFALIEYVRCGISLDPVRDQLAPHDPASMLPFRVLGHVDKHGAGRSAYSNSSSVA